MIFIHMVSLIVVYMVQIFFGACWYDKLVFLVIQAYVRIIAK